MKPSGFIAPVIQCTTCGAYNVNMETMQGILKQPGATTMTGQCVVICNRSVPQDQIYQWILQAHMASNLNVSNSWLYCYLEFSCTCIVNVLMCDCCTENSIDHVAPVMKGNAV